MFLMDLGLLIACIPVLLFLLLFLPFKGARRFTFQSPSSRFHEADSVLSRRLLKPGTADYKAYYERHPEFKEADDLSRQAPGLLSKGSRYHHPGTFAAADANFHIIESMGSQLHWKPQLFQGNPDPGRTSVFITHWLKRTGAHSIGITRLQPHHLYSHKGRGPRSGEPIEMKHTTAIAITVEMDRRMMLSAPAGTAVMESSEQYLRSAVLARKLAAFIGELGYDATSHIDGNYEVICPLVAQDAGLGTIGRMGLLMTPALGPRVRISVVTTDMELPPSAGGPEPTTLHFCHVCKKCAMNCPASAIPEGPRTLQDGVPRWRINSEKCYHFWALSGTDCGRCIAVCPYSHKNSLLHRFIRWGIKNNLLFRYLATKLDDIFYGRRPSIRPLPGWAEIMDRP